MLIKSRGCGESSFLLFAIDDAFDLETDREADLDADFDPDRPSGEIRLG